jgi:hypothetical protein
MWAKAARRNNMRIEFTIVGTYDIECDPDEDEADVKDGAASCLEEALDDYDRNIRIVNLSVRAR